MSPLHLPTPVSSSWSTATEVVTVFVFQEPSLLSSLQDNGLTDVMLHALLIKDVSLLAVRTSFWSLLLLTPLTSLALSLSDSCPPTKQSQRPCVSLFYFTRLPSFPHLPPPSPVSTFALFLTCAFPSY